MIEVFLFAVAAGVCAVVRSTVMEVLNHQEFPWGTLAVNATGSLLAGIVAAHAPASATTVLGVAALGALTTFSTFAVEVRSMWTGGQRIPGTAYAGVTVVAAVGAAAFGLGL